MQSESLAGDPLTVFVADRNSDSVPNAFDYLFGTNWSLGLPILKIASSTNGPVVEVPKQAPDTLPFAWFTVEMTERLAPTDWSTNVVPAASTSGKPPNRDWYQPGTPVSNAFFRLKAYLK